MESNMPDPVNDTNPAPAPAPGPSFDSGKALSERDRKIAEQQAEIAALKAKLGGSSTDTSTEGKEGGTADTPPSTQSHGNKDAKDLAAQLAELKAQFETLSKQGISNQVSKTGIDKYINADGSFDEGFVSWAQTTKLPIIGTNVAAAYDAAMEKEDYAAVARIVSSYEEYLDTQLAATPGYGNSSSKSMTVEQRNSATKLASLQKQRKAALAENKYQLARKLNAEINALRTS